MVGLPCFCASAKLLIEKGLTHAGTDVVFVKGAFERVFKLLMNVPLIISELKVVPIGAKIAFRREWTAATAAKWRFRGEIILFAFFLITQTLVCGINLLDFLLCLRFCRS